MFKQIHDAFICWKNWRQVDHLFILCQTCIKHMIPHISQMRLSNVHDTYRWVHQVSQVSPHQAAHPHRQFRTPGIQGANKGLPQDIQQQSPCEDQAVRFQVLVQKEPRAASVVGVQPGKMR